MSCSSLDPYPYRGLIDTLGSKGDPIKSEKDFLIFLVRRLSREVVGKGKGQQALWKPNCKPSWWNDAEIGLWKNPTENPKDTKEILFKKYNALENNLLTEGKYPEDFEEASALYKNGELQELFRRLKENDLWRSVEHICTEFEDPTFEVQSDVLEQIIRRLSSGIETVKNRKTQNSMLKETKQNEHHDRNQSAAISGVKKRKLETSSASTKKLRAKKFKPQPQQNKVQKPNTDDSTGVSSITILSEERAVSDESNNSATDSQNSDDSTITKDQTEIISDCSRRSTSYGSGDAGGGSDSESQVNHNLKEPLDKLPSDISAEELCKRLGSSRNSDDSTMPEDQVDVISDSSRPTTSYGSSDADAGSDSGSQENHNRMELLEKLLLNAIEKELTEEELHELDSIISDKLLSLCDNKEDFLTENDLNDTGDGEN